MTVCSECKGLGYKEYEAGLIRVPCEACEETGEIAETEGMVQALKYVNSALPTARECSEALANLHSEITSTRELLAPNEFTQHIGYSDGDKTSYAGQEVIDDSNSGTGQPDSSLGSADTGKPKQSRKPKARKKTRT